MAAACDVLSSQSGWLVYAYEMNHNGYIIFCIYDEQKKLFPAQDYIEMESVSFFDIGIKNDVLYVALATEEGIIIQKMRKGEADFTDGGKIEAKPRWMRWIRGNNNIFLLTDIGLYQGDDWTNVEAQQPFRTKDSYPWCGVSGGRIVSLAVSEKENGAAVVWATDTL